MSAGWQWAYRALKDGVLSVEDIKDIIYRGITLSDKQFCEDAKRGLVDYLEELSDEEAIAKEEQDGRQGI